MVPCPVVYYHLHIPINYAASFINEAVVKNISTNTTRYLSMSSRNKREFHLILTTKASKFSPQTEDHVDYSESELLEHGISLSHIGDSHVLTMALKNGTSTKLMLPSGLITSFKVQMWHSGMMELLHTLVSATEDQTRSHIGSSLIQGGLSLSLNLDCPGHYTWCPDTWALHRVKGAPRKSIQVELISTNEDANAQVKHLISLGRDFLSSEVVVYNFGTSPLHIMGLTMCHLGVSTPDATYALGLEGSEFFVQLPLLTDYSIVPPNLGIGENDWKFQRMNTLFYERKERTSNTENLAREVVSSLGGEEEEEDSYKHLTEKISRIYSNATRSLTIMDRGKRNSVTMGRDGYEEVYLLSPGSEHEWHGKYAYVCIGHGALLKPIKLNPQNEWRGRMQVFNPNT